MADPRTTDSMATGGARLFAAVTGSDVDYRMRHRLAADLKAVLDRKRAAEESRAMAAMWLGLVFLSDPEEFAKWRAPARDAMLACEDPPHSPFGPRMLAWRRHAAVETAGSLLTGAAIGASSARAREGRRVRPGPA